MVAAYVSFYYRYIIGNVSARLTEYVLAVLVCSVMSRICFDVFGDIKLYSHTILSVFISELLLFPFDVNGNVLYICCIS